MQCGSSEGYYCKALPSLLAAGWVCQDRVCRHTPGELLPHLFTLACGIKPIGGLFSVALSLAFWRQPVRLTLALLQPGLSSGKTSTLSVCPHNYYIIFYYHIYMYNHLKLLHYALHLVLLLKYLLFLDDRIYFLYLLSFPLLK